LLGSIGGSPALSAHSLRRSEQKAFRLKLPRLPGVSDLAKNLNNLLTIQDLQVGRPVLKVLVGVEVKTG
jgi:hypothetical protein